MGNLKIESLRYISLNKVRIPCLVIWPPIALIGTCAKVFIPKLYILVGCNNPFVEAEDILSNPPWIILRLFLELLILD